MKRAVYIAAFTFLGLLVSTLIHAAIELPVLNLLSSDLETYGDSWLWQNWGLVHGIGSVVLWLVGAVGGFWGGVHYWRILYIEKRYGEKKW